MRFGPAVLLAAIACGGGKPPVETTAVPADVIELSAPGPELSAIAMAAAKALRPNRQGRIEFGSVGVGGRTLNALSDSVARSVGATRVGGDRKVPFSVCRVGTACPDAGADDGPVSFTHFRSGMDQAYVGGEAKSLRDPEGAVCISLRRVAGEWRFVERKPIKNPRNCGVTP